MESSFTAQLQYAIETLMSPMGAIAAISWVFLLVALIFSPKVKWLVLIVMMWCAALSFSVKEGSVIHLAMPLDQIRAQSRLLQTAFLIALAVPALLAPRNWRLHVISLPILLYFFFEMLLGLRILIAGVEDRGVTTLFVYPVVFVVFGWGASKWMQDWDDVHKLLRCIAIAGAVYVFGCCYQLLINPSAIMAGHRLMGTSGNPQWAALLISMSLPATCYLVARPSEPVAWRIALAAIAGLMIVMLLWTGSRTGIAIATLGIALTFRSRLGRLLLIGLIVGIFVLLAMQIYDESTESLAEMFTRGNTRAEVWSEMYRNFIANPAFGSLHGGFSTSENSYLATASAMGVCGIVPLFAFVGAALWTIVRLFKVRRWLGPEQAFADLLIGSMIAIFLGANFEAYLLGTLTFPVFMVYIDLVLARFVLDAVEASQYEASLRGFEVLGIPAVDGQTHFPLHDQIAEQYL